MGGHWPVWSITLAMRLVTVIKLSMRNAAGTGGRVPGVVWVHGEHDELDDGTMLADAVGTVRVAAPVEARYGLCLPDRSYGSDWPDEVLRGCWGSIEHVHGSIQIDNGNSPDGYSGMTIQGDSNDIQLRLELQTFVIIQADGAPAGNADCHIASVATGLSPDSTPQVTITVSPPLPFGSGSPGSANINVLNAQASPSINGFTVATFVTAADTSRLHHPDRGNRDLDWRRHRAVHQGSRSLTLDGKINNVVVYNTDSTGCINQTSDIVPGAAPVQQYAISRSPYLRFNGQYPPAFRLALVDATSASLTGAVTGNGSIIVVPFNTLSYDNNGDFRGLTSPYTAWTCYYAGIYRVRARVCVANLSSSNPSMTLQIYQNIKAGGDIAYSCLENIIATTEGTYQVIEVTDTIFLNYRDSLQVRLVVDGKGPTRPPLPSGTPAAASRLSAPELL